MKQKLGIAQALMENPDLIILDEPTNALDEESVKNILNIIKEEKRKNKIILISSHDKSILEEISDEIINIENGKNSIRENFHMKKKDIFFILYNFVFLNKYD